jgi:PAS domain S-box-containing protein
VESEVVVIADGSGVIRFWSAGAQAAFGHSAARAVGETLDLIVPPEHRAAHWSGFRRAVEASSAALEGEATPFPVRCADGVVREATGRLTLARRPDGRVAAVIVAFDTAAARR